MSGEQPDSAETAKEKDRHQEAVERDKAACRKATEGSRGKRRRGGGLKEESSTRSGEPAKGALSR